LPTKLSSLATAAVMSREQKRRKEELIETSWERSVLGEAAIFCSSNQFQEKIDKFKRRYISLFEEYLDTKSCEDIEQNIQCTIAFQEYQTLIEDLLEEFVENHGSTVADFSAECRSSLNGDFTALFEEHEHQWFVEALLSWMDYQTFFEDMVKTARYAHK
jgi:hypothetical protein